MRKRIPFQASQVALVALTTGVFAGCAASTPAPAPAPVAAAPAPAPVATTPPAVAVTPPPSAPPAEAPPPAAPKHHAGHGMAAMFVASLDSLVLKPEQKTAVDGIEADLQKTHEAAKAPREKLEGDVADGVAAGKIDHAKTDADIRALTAAVAATQPSVQDAMNRLYKTLDVEQRKKLVEVMREKGKEMHAHGFGEHEHEGGHEHEGKGPGGHEHEGKGPGGMEHEGKGQGGHEHEGKGPGGMEHGPGGMEHGGPLMQLGEALGLTAEQKEKIHVKLEAQMKAHHTAMKDKMAAAEKHMAAIGDAFVSDKFDAKKAGVGTQAPEMVKAMASMRIEFVETILAVLTPEQRAKFAAHVREHAAEEEAE